MTILMKKLGSSSALALLLCATGLALLVCWKISSNYVDQPRFTRGQLTYDVVWERHAIRLYQGGQEVGFYHSSDGVFCKVPSLYLIDLDGDELDELWLGDHCLGSGYMRLQEGRWQKVDHHEDPRGLWAKWLTQGWWRWALWAGIALLFIGGFVAGGAPSQEAGTRGPERSP